MPQIFFGLCIAAKRTIFHLYLSFHIECYKLTNKLELPNHCNLDRTVCEIWAAFHMKMVWVIGKSGRQREIVSLGVGWPIAWKDNRCGVRKKHNQRDKDIRLQLRGTLKDIKQTYRITFFVVEHQPQWSYVEEIKQRENWIDARVSAAIWSQPAFQSNKSRVGRFSRANNR